MGTDLQDVFTSKVYSDVTVLGIQVLISCIIIEEF